MLGLAQPLCAEYFENAEFQEKLSEWYGEEFRMVTMLRNLAKDIAEEAKQTAFNFERTRALAKQLADCLTSKRRVMIFEFKESGLLDALALFLTSTPAQARAIKERERQGEEVKHSEEMQMSQLLKNAQQISKKEARCFVQRLKVFAHVVLSKGLNDHQPIQELISLCHELLSQSEAEIFNLQSDPAQGSIYGGVFSTGVQGVDDPNQSVAALRQLTKRVRINLVYDPTKCFIKQLQQSPKTDLLQAPQLSVTKASSHHPAFLVLGDQKGEEQHSKVFMKRNLLYSELQQVLISVEQCASLWLLEDFLRSKIKTLDDVKGLKQPQQSFYQSLKRGDKPLEGPARQILDRALDRMRDMIEGGSSRDRFREEGDEFAELLSQEIVDSKELKEAEQLEIIRQLERQALQVMEDFYLENQGSSSYQELVRDDMLPDEEEEELNAEQRMFEMQRTIELLRQLYRGKKQDMHEKAKNEEDASMNEAEPPKGLEAFLQRVKQAEEEE